ncbi:thiol reductant ABC exporter subunit CydD [Marinobacter sp. SS21]|uniref:thiol reductant ABC exporter subunit CydD n=1 Tax=Marinobacter sp. SS21 TaxID=2979460 RepID=UPI00233000E0|nr:thiol reductant ABC exporter subunit CydD [Marinobacter sp. SS21]MDC0664320.1 thiol reductant ABC exporter subunit CydD [Marinobacter sp. SS21]
MEDALAQPRSETARTGAKPRHGRTWLNQLAKAQRETIALTVAAGTLAGVFTIAQMGLFAWVIHQAVVEQVPLMALSAEFAGVALAMALRALAQGMQAQFAARASRKIRERVRQQLTEVWQGLSPARLKSSSAATLSTEWLDQVEALHGYFARFLPQLAICGAVPLLILGVVISLDWLAGLFLLLSAPLIPLFMALIGLGAEKVNQQHFKVLGRLSGQFLDKVRGLTTLQLFGATHQAAGKLQERSEQFRRVTMKTLKVAFLSSAVLEFFASVAIAVVAMYIGFGLLGYINIGPADQLTLFSGLFVLLLAPEFFQPLRQLAQHYHDRAAALGAAELLLARLATDVARADQAPEATHSERDTSIIQLSDVSVSYPGATGVLNRVSCKLRRGQCVALRGRSGGGKSTLLHLLAGFVAPNGGAVSVFGEPPGLRRFGWLGQSPFLMQGSWADNLKLVAPAATDDAILSALTLVGLRPLLESRPEGLYSAVTEQGAGLSGGQARRLSLARVFLADFDLVLLDEPTAGLDEVSQQGIIDALTTLKSQGKTLVFATHHERLLELADRTLWVEHGALRDA